MMDLLSYAYAFYVIALEDGWYLNFKVSFFFDKEEIGVVDFSEVSSFFYAYPNYFFVVNYLKLLNYIFFCCVF